MIIRQHVKPAFPALNIALASILCAFPGFGFAADKCDASDQFSKSINIGRLGSIAFVADSRSDAPIAKAAEPVRLRQLVELCHTLHSGYKFPPIFLRTEASRVALDSLHEGENEIGHLQVEFGGVLLAGLPKYLELKASKFLKDNQIDLKRVPGSSSRATLTRRFAVTISKPTIQKLKNYDVRLQSLALHIDQLQASATTAQHAQLEALKLDYSNLEADKYKLLRRATETEFPCLPSIREVIRFPIWEKGGDSQSSGQSGKASATAKIGVSGDVDILLAPRCGIALGPQYNLETYIKVPLKLLSHGYFGGRADWSGSISISFLSDKFGNYLMAPDDVVGAEERETLGQILHDAVYSAKDASDLNAAILALLRNGEVLVDVRNRIIENLIGTSSNPAPIDKICSLFRAGRVPAGSPEDSICKYASQARPQLVLPPQPPTIPIPDPPNGVCGDEAHFGACRPPSMISPPCPPRPPECALVNGPQCHCPPQVPVPDSPLGCYALLQTNRRLCDAIQSFPERLRQAQKEALDREKAFRAAIAESKRAFELSMAQFLKYTDKAIVYQTALAFARANILYANLSEPVAHKLIDTAIDAAEKGQQQVDIIAGIVKPEYLQYLTIQAKGSARLALKSTAHILEVSPSITDVVGECPGDVARRELCRTVSFYQHHDQTKPVAASLDPIGFTFDIEGALTVIGKDVPIGPVHYEVSDTVNVAPLSGLISTEPLSITIKIPK